MDENRAGSGDCGASGRDAASVGTGTSGEDTAGAGGGAGSEASAKDGAIGAAHSVRPAGEARRSSRSGGT
ncbi:hypothetical protein D3C73_1209890 [compost metagenome]